jgi:hypothetical protein
MTAGDDPNKKPRPGSDRQDMEAELLDDVRRWEWEGGAVAASTVERPQPTRPGVRAATAGGWGEERIPHRR